MKDETEVDILNISDEDFEKLPLPESEVETVDVKVDITDNKTISDTSTDTTTDKEKKDTENLDTEVSTTKETLVVDDKKEDTSTDDKKEEVSVVDNKEEDTSTNYENEYKKLMTPFKANGENIQIKSVDDAIQLMQMGANYHKKMVGLKPSLKIMKLLEENSLLDPAKINFLVDLSKNNPEAIHKLIKESGIDPLTLNVDADTKYVERKDTVSDSLVDIDLILDNIKDTPGYNRTLNVIGKDWDTNSRAEIANNPKVIEIINAHIGNGIFDTVSKAVAYERSFGRLTGLSDFAAYKQVGDALHNEGKLNPVNEQAKSNTLDNTNPNTKTDASVNSSDEEARKARKAKVAPTKIGTTTKTEYNPLSLSDEEFEKLEKAGGLLA